MSSVHIESNGLTHSAQTDIITVCDKRPTGLQIYAQGAVIQQPEAGAEQHRATIKGARSQRREVPKARGPKGAGPKGAGPADNSCAHRGTQPEQTRPQYTKAKQKEGKCNGRKNVQRNWMHT